jgi:DNA-binding response OmpR family regulator
VAQQRVVIVEDDPDFAALLSALLEEEGYGVVTAETALGTAELVRRVCPCAVLLDVGLPYRSGVSLLDKLKADPSSAGVPVVVITGVPEILTDERRRMAAAVLAKPVDMRTLATLVRTLCPEQ